MTEDQLQDRAAEDIIGTVIKYYLPHKDKEQLKRVLKSTYFLIEKTSPKGKTLLENAGSYAEEAEKRLGKDLHPKTASFQGFIAGAISNEQKPKP